MYLTYDMRGTRSDKLSLPLSPPNIPPINGIQLQDLQQAPNNICSLENDPSFDVRRSYKTKSIAGVRKPYSSHQARNPGPDPPDHPKLYISQTNHTFDGHPKHPELLPFERANHCRGHHDIFCPIGGCQRSLAFNSTAKSFTKAFNLKYVV
jgi:hypothetical protein